MSDDKKKPKKTFPFEMTIDLRKSITLGSGDNGTVYTEIALREPTAGELGQFFKKTQNASAIDAVKFLISAVSGVPLVVIDKIGASDYYKAQEYLLFFCNPPDEDDPEGNAEGSQ
jgi:hypothetical protein